MYGGGAETLRNYISLQQGGIRRRSGSRYAGTAKYTDKLATFVPFVFSATGDAYILEFGHQYIRFWAHGPAQLVSAGTTPLEVATPYDHLDVDDIQFVQVGDAIYLAHNSYAPRKLLRLSSNNWQFGTLAFTDGPWMAPNDTDTSVYVDEATPNLDEGATVTLQFSALTGINSGTGFKSTDVGRQLRVRSTTAHSGGSGSGAAMWMSGTITSVNSTTSVEFLSNRVGDGTSSADNRIDAGSIPSTSPSKSWRLGAFSGTTGYPKCVEVFESRLAWANTAAEPRTMYFSRTGLPTDYAPSAGDSTVTAEHGLSLTVLAGLVDQILWLKEAPRLQIGTASGIRTIGGSDTTQPLSSSNVSQRLEVNYGVNEAIPASAGSSGIAAGRFGTTLRNVYFDYRVNQIVAPDISRLHDHLLLGRLSKIVFQQVPESVIWGLTDEGTVIGVTYDQQENVTAYHRHDFGGDAVVRSIGVIPGPDRDEVWLLVSRNINGVEQMYVEVIDPEFDVENDELEAAFFVDCGVTYTGIATNTVSGATHLAGEEVIALVDGAVIRNLTVGTDGTLTLPNSRTGSTIHFGYPITSEFKTLRPPHQAQDGFTLGRRQRVANAHIEVLKTGGLRVGSRSEADGGSLSALQERLNNTAFGAPTALKQGVYKVPISDQWSDGGQVYGVITDPLPAYVRSILIALDVET